MAVKITKPEINVREKLAELDKPSGIAGEAMLRAETPQEQFNLIGAGRRNLIINGDMQVTQRGTSFTAEAYTLDRWYLNLSGGAATVTWNQFTRGSELDGIKNYLKLNVTQGDNYLGMVHKVEGARALPTGKATLSWWAKGVNPASGNIVCNIQLINNGSTNFNTPLSDTFSVTTSWQKYTRIVDIPDYTGMGSETSAGSWTYLRFSQEAGDTSTATWSLDITGVQLEAGPVATPFEHRSYGEQLALCQRYYTETNFNVQGYQGSGNYASENIHWQQRMRTVPTVTRTDGTLSNVSATSTQNVTENGCRIEIQATNSGRAFNFGGIAKADAEL